MTELFAKTQLKIIATLGNSIRPDAETLRGMESEVIAVLEKHGLIIETQESHGVIYKSVLFSFESCR